MNVQLPPNDARSSPAPVARHTAPAGGLRIALTTRMGLLISLMTLIVLAAGLGSFWSAGSTADQIESIRLSNSMTTQVNAVQSHWIALMGVLDKTVMSKPIEDDFEALTARMEDLNQALNGLASSIDDAAAIIDVQESRQILLDLRSIYARTDSLASEMFKLADEERFDEALQVRRADLPELQSQVLEALDRLDAILTNEIDTRYAATAQTQLIARLISGAAVLVALVMAVNVFWIGRRVIVQPLALLKARIARIAEGDFSPSEQVARLDEIGELSQAIEKMAGAVRTAQAELEQRIHERTEALERRTVQVQVAAQTARDIASARGLSQLLENAVDLIRDRFGFYHAGIFMTDARGEYQTLRAATGEAGRAMLARAHSLRIGEAGGSEPTGLVGSAAHRGEPLVSSDVSQDQSHFKNPLLPETRSEAALPLKAGGRVIGVLDVQSRQPDAFDPESLNILQVMADQLAIAIQNASLLGEVQRNLADMQQAYGELERKAWLRFFQGAPKLGYVYDGLDIRAITADGQPRSVSLSAAQENGDAPFAMPLRVRGQEIGVLEVWPRQNELSSEETYLLTALNNRLSQILESARLYEETQGRAARESLINQLTAQIAQATDLDGVLRAAAVELAGIPAVREATVAILQPEPALPSGKRTDRDEDIGGGNGHRA